MAHVADGYHLGPILDTMHSWLLLAHVPPGATQIYDCMRSLHQPPKILNMQDASGFGSVFYDNFIIASKCNHMITLAMNRPDELQDVRRPSQGDHTFHSQNAAAEPDDRAIMYLSGSTDLHEFE